MKIGYLGNFRHSFCTEAHVAEALEGLGHIVLRIQEGDFAPRQMAPTLFAFEADMLFWTQTEPLYRQHPVSEWQRMMQRVQSRIPIVGFHLDRWWGLQRQKQVRTNLFFKSNFVFTADGGNDAKWREAKVNHHWSPPGVLARECEPGDITPEWQAPIAFVGSWKSYHPEWPHRKELVRHLQRRWNAAVWPTDRAIRERDLANLYASVDILVGDSCLVQNATNYWSDRIPETLGRGGFLIHPAVRGLENHFTPGEHLATWELGNWDHLDNVIDSYLNNPEEAHRIAKAGREHVLQHHTYEKRLSWVLETVASSI